MDSPIDSFSFIKEINVEKFEKFQKEIYDCYRDIDNAIEMYLDIEPSYRKIISLWIIGTYFHKTFPVLFVICLRGMGSSIK